jgi:DNA sulfur modification protein DndD
MTLDRLVLENFGAYRGKHVIPLTPPSRKRPIVLFGGLNGAGKTTLLDALQLVLYGKRARCSNRGTVAYDEFLRRSINRYADPSGGACIELSFHHINDGATQEFRVVRSWHANGNGIKETIDVYVDRRHDPTVSDSWAEYAEEFIPSRLSHLFFFDGEKIEALADLDNAADVLRSGIHSLLGLDLVDRLHDDLDVIANRKEKRFQVDDGTNFALTTAEAEVRDLRPRRDELIQNIAGIQAQLDQCDYRLEQVAEKLQTEGGELFRQKDLLDSNKRSLLQELDDVDVALRDLANGAAPFLLVPDLLAGVHEQIRIEKLSMQASLLDETLLERDALLLKTIRKLGTSPTVQENVAAFLAADRRERTASRDLPRFLLLSEDAASLLHDLRAVSLPSARQKLVELLTRRKDIAHALIAVERKLSTVPEEDAIAPFEREREELEIRRAGLQDAQARLRDERQRLDHELGRKESTLKRLQEEATRSALEKEDLARVNQHARRAQAALLVFRDRVVERHLSRIETHVEESFRYLLRKQTLVTSLHIDHRTYALELRDATGILLHPDRLSAGERQLLAVSLLWGLAKASRRPLPAVIDTPLGRLDSSHRRHLVERYFPAASHQVLLLSTDEEIRGEYLDALRPAIGHSYLLQYDEAARSSTVVQGYFTPEDMHAA